MAQKMTAEQFFGGLFAALACKGWRAVATRGEVFQKAVASTFQKLMEQAPEKGIDPRFRIYLDPIHLDSPTIWDSVSKAAQRDLISLANPEFVDIEIKLSKNGAQSLLSAIPGGVGLFAELAEHFVAQYEAY
jgi:hypothetical protein